MIRMYRKMAQDLFQVVSWVHDQGFKNISRVREANRIRRTLPGEKEEYSVAITTALKSAYEYSRGEDELGPVVLDIAKMLNNERFQGDADRDLIDIIVNTLQLPYPRNLLGGKTLEQLSRAILLPEELGKLTSRLKEREMSCGNCGKELHVGESVTIQGEGKSRSLMCTVCYTPELFACGCRKGVGPFPQKFRRALEKGIVKCDRCRDTGENKEGVDGAEVEIGQAVERGPVRGGAYQQAEAVPRGRNRNLEARIPVPGVPGNRIVFGGDRGLGVPVPVPRGVAIGNPAGRAPEIGEGIMWNPPNVGPQNDPLEQNDGPQEPPVIYDGRDAVAADAFRPAPFPYRLDPPEVPPVRDERGAGLQQDAVQGARAVRRLELALFQNIWQE